MQRCLITQVSCRAEYWRASKLRPFHCRRREGRFDGQTASGQSPTVGLVAYHANGHVEDWDCCLFQKSKESGRLGLDRGCKFADLNQTRPLIGAHETHRLVSSEVESV